MTEENRVLHRARSWFSVSLPSRNGRVISIVRDTFFADSLARILGRKRILPFGTTTLESTLFNTKKIIVVDDTRRRTTRVINVVLVIYLMYDTIQCKIPL